VLTSELLDIIRQRVGEVVAEIGGDNPKYLNETLLRYVKTANFVLASHGITTGLVIDPTLDVISPEPIDDAHGLLLAIYSASSLVADDLLYKLRIGELGLSFTTGATQITTNQAAITLKDSSKVLRNEFNRLITLYLSGDPNAVVERLQ
jgi:hypothetical protein